MIKQVEFNTIASSFGGLTSLLVPAHKLVSCLLFSLLYFISQISSSICLFGFFLSITAGLNHCLDFFMTRYFSRFVLAEMGRHDLLKRV